MNTRILGRTGLEVTELSLGGLFIASFAVEEEEACKTVKRALDLGINYIDTAPSYGNSEEVLGKALEGDEKPYYISTKLGGRPEPFDPRNKDGLMYSIEESLRLLRRDYIDIVFIHEPGRPGQYDWWTDPKSYYGPVIEVLEQLKDERIIRFTGLGGTTAYEIVPIIETGSFDVLLTASNYSLLWREAEIAILRKAREQNMGIVVGSPLQHGALAREYQEVYTGARWLSPPRRKQFQELYSFAHEIGVSLAELGLRFVLSNPDISTVLTGVKSTKEIEQNVAVAEKGSLSPDILERLDEIAAMVPFRPFEEPFDLPLGREYKGPGSPG